MKANSASKVIVCKRSIYALSDGGNATIAATSTPVKIGTIPDPAVAKKRSKIDDNGDHTVDMLDPSIDQAPLNETELIELSKLENEQEVTIEDNDDPATPAVEIDDDDSNKLEDLILRKDRKAVPKSVLYSELLPYLPQFQRIFLMDEDISLVGFDFENIMKIWNCAFYPFPPPLVVQPLIAESNQYFKFVGVKAWSGMGVLATASGIVEQQVPMFDATFFEWFVKRCLSMTKQDAIDAGVDWGGDRSWCNAAKMYGRDVLKQKREYVHCALLVGGTPVHHMNTKAIASKRTNKKEFLKQGFMMVDKYVNLFPTWTILDITRSPNPLDRLHGRKYVKSKKLDANCTKSKKFLFN